LLRRGLLAKTDLREERLLRRRLLAKTDGEGKGCFVEDPLHRVDRLVKTDDERSCFVDDSSPKDGKSCEEWK